MPGLTPTRALGPDGPFLRLLEGFSPRAQQQAMAEAVAETMESYGTLVCEAGTGTGKTLAYLTPALLSGKKVVISTGTKNLQDQLFHRDLPMARQALELPVRTALLKGRANYLCLHRLARAELRGRQATREDFDMLVRVRQWAGRTRTGDIGEVAGIPEDSIIWPQVTSTVDNCLGQECPDYEDCFVLKARRAAIAAELVVVNHHLFFADMALREEGFGELLPGADAVVLDEAHQLPDVATHFFGQSLSARQLKELAHDVQAAWLEEAGDVPEVPAATRRLDKAVRDFRLALGVEAERITWSTVAGRPAVMSAQEALSEALATLAEQLGALAERGRELQSCHRRCGALLERFAQLSERVSETHVHWIECHARGFVWHRSPLEVGEQFMARVQAQKSAWVFTSATLAVDGRFDHFAARMGLLERRDGLWGSPFDYARQALCYCPPGLPDPRTPNHTSAVVAAVQPVLEASRGRAFVLFTSYRALDEAADRLAREGGYSLLVQGSAPRNELLSRFRATPNAVLLGTGSFWEGVDVRGEALSCVIIDKLPFAAPGEPVLAARCRAMRNRGEDPFVTYQLPQAVIALKQGVGRLIRDITDSGVLVLCDPRLLSKPYGRVFFQSLPPMPRSNRIEDVQAFFARQATGSVAVAAEAG